MLHLPAAKIHTARRDAADVLVAASLLTAQPDPHPKCKSREPSETVKEGQDRGDAEGLDEI